MSAFTTLLALINAQIKTNGVKAITGQKLNGVLVQMVNELGAECQFGGLVLPSTSFTAGDFPVAFLATEAGTYTDFGGAVLDGNFLHILSWDGSSNWTDTETNIPAGDALSEYAKKDGYYATLTAGAAENLVGRGSVPASFLFRTTGGTADVGTGAAVLAAIKGKSLVWNQQVKNGNFEDATNWTLSGTPTLSVVDNVATLSKEATPGTSVSSSIFQYITIIPGHKYYVSVGVRSNNSATQCRILFYGPNSINQSIKDYTVYASEFSRVSGIVEAVEGLTNVRITIRNVPDNTQDVNFSVKEFFAIDLTLMFGAGNEPSTVEDFEKLYPLPYYDYNGGKVLPFAGQKLVTMGENLYNPATGKARLPEVSSSVGFKIQGTYSALSFLADGAAEAVAITPDGNGQFTTSGAGVLTVTGGDDSSTMVYVYWSGEDKDFTPYEVHELELNPATLLDKDGNLVFPYGGMHGTGTAFDLMKPEADGFIHYANRVYAEVDLGTLTWVRNDTDYEYAYFSAAIPNRKNGSINMICERYSGPVRSRSLLTNDKTFGTYNLSSSSSVVVRDDSYADAASFKAAMSGVKLYFEVQTPAVVELATPIAATYYANDWGTEEWQPANGAEPYTAPCHLDIDYAMNAGDLLRNLPRNYIGAEDFDAYNAALAAALTSVGITMTYARTFNQETDHHQFTITMAETPEESQGE